MTGSNIATRSINPMSAAYDKLSAMTVEDLRGELVRALTVTAESLMYLAAVWKELERRGEDLSDLRTGLGAYVPLIAAGHLAAEAVVAFAGRKRLLEKVMRLPVEKQMALASGERVTVVDYSQDGTLVEREMPAAALTMEQANIVFDEGRVRLPVEQKRIRQGKPRSKMAIVALRLTEEEHIRLKESSRQRGQTMQSAIISALRVEKLI